VPTITRSAKCPVCKSQETKVVMQNDVRPVWYGYAEPATLVSYGHHVTLECHTCGRTFRDGFQTKHRPYSEDGQLRPCPSKKSDWGYYRHGRYFAKKWFDPEKIEFVAIK